MLFERCVYFLLKPSNNFPRYFSLRYLFELYLYFYFDFYCYVKCIICYIYIIYYISRYNICAYFTFDRSHNSGFDLTAKQVDRMCFGLV